jgi:hypothetical protein
MRSLRSVVAVAFSVMSAAACNSETRAPQTTSESPSGATAIPAATGAGAAGENEVRRFENFDPKNFDRSSVIDNQWFPLKPGTQFVYEGVAVEGGERAPHRVVFTVTDLTKVINGVRTVVIADQDFSDGKMIETELTFFAQDKDGNVWHLGQYRETYDETEFVGGRVWLDGYLDGAKAGIMMPADPQVGNPSFSEGYAPAPFNWTDRARVYQMGQKTRVPVGSYDDVLVMEENNEEEPGAFQLKYYARGIGIVRVGWRGDDATQETLELVKRVELSPEEMAKVRGDALELEKRAYIYARTPPAEYTPGGAGGAGE